MLALLQRVKSAQVLVLNHIVGEIGAGLLVFLGVQKMDTKAQAKRLAERVLGYRIFSDDQQQMNRSVLDTRGELLIVSQFTLAADTQKGMRPGFSTAAAPEEAQSLYQYFVQQISQSGLKVATGQFGAKMEVSLINDGPVTFLLNC